MSGQVERGAGDLVVRAITAIMAAVVGLTFLFGFGNVLILALRLGVPAWVAPLVAPAVDLTVLGLLLGMRYLALHGAGRELLHPARRLLLFASIVTQALKRLMQDFVPSMVAALYEYLLTDGRQKRDTNGEMYELWKEACAADREIRPREIADKVGVTYAAARRAVRRYEVGRIPMSKTLSIQVKRCDDARDGCRPGPTTRPHPQILRASLPPIFGRRDGCPDHDPSVNLSSASSTA